jgi:hypothetical protein
MSAPVPTPPSSGRPPWFPMATAGGITALVIGSLVIFSGGGDDLSPGGGTRGTTTIVAGTAQTTSVAATTSPGPPTTATTTMAPITTTLAPTTTTTVAPTTTTTPAENPTVYFDMFDGPTDARPVFAEEFMTFGATGDDTAEIRANGPGVLPVMYPASVGDAVVIVDIRSDLVDPGSGVGLIVLSEDPSDAVIDYYVAVYINPSFGDITVAPFVNGDWGELETFEIPTDAGFDAAAFNNLAVVITDGEIALLINDVYIGTWAGAAPATEGYTGFMVVSLTAGDRAEFDDFILSLQ